MYGKGLRSIRTRFTLMIAGFCLLVMVAHLTLDIFNGETSLLQSPLTYVLLVLSVVIPGGVTYRLAGSLVGSIHALKSSTEALIAGDFDRPVEVDCSCEVGGLAESFRTMVGKLNTNIVRMNVLAYNDAVTGFANRTVVQHALQRAMDAPGGPVPLSVLFLDLDGFKAVNDSLGHEAGDALLRQASLRIVEQGLLRTRKTLDSYTTSFGELHDRPPADIVFARFAGDEFIAVLPGMVDRDEIDTVCARIHDAVSAPFVIGNATAQISVSIGIACAPFDASDPADLLVNADMAMYAAKGSGRGLHSFFDADLRHQIVGRLALERELLEGIANDQMLVHYQPKFCAASLKVVGYEALVRWQHPVRGLLYPGQFIAIAEKAEVMCELGEVVFSKALRQLSEWKGTPRALPIAVNVSASQFRNPKLVERMEQMLNRSGIDPSLIELEITEQVAMGDFGLARETLNRLREGCTCPSMILVSATPTSTSW